MVFYPHIGGFGHRVRCNLIAERLKALRADLAISFLDRRDDPLFDRPWTTFPRRLGPLARTLAIAAADLLVEDGSVLPDLRRAWVDLRGAVVTILNPNVRGDIEVLRRTLGRSRRIIVPYPRGLLEPHPVLNELRGKVIWTGPILNVPAERGARPESSGAMVILASREVDRIETAARALATRLGLEVAPREFVDTRTHVERLLRASVALTQGTTAMFECAFLGVPQVCVPWNEEQILVADALSRRGITVSVPAASIREETLERAVQEVVFDPVLAAERVERGRELVPASGVDLASRTVLLVLEE